MMEVHWMVWSIALRFGVLVDGVAQIANRVAFCMASLCDLYTTIVHTISIIRTISTLTPTLQRFIPAFSKLAILTDAGRKDPIPHLCHYYLQRIPVASSSHSRRVTALGRKIDRQQQGDGNEEKAQGSL